LNCDHRRDPSLLLLERVDLLHAFLVGQCRFLQIELLQVAVAVKVLLLILSAQFDDLKVLFVRLRQVLLYFFSVLIALAHVLEKFFASIFLLLSNG
jgi:hypothetical protein